MIASRFSQALVLSIGFALVWGIGVAWCFTMFLPRPTEPYTSLVYDENGQLYLQKYSEQHRAQFIKRWDAPEATWKPTKYGDPQLSAIDLSETKDADEANPEWSPVVFGWHAPLNTLYPSDAHHDPAGTIYYFVRTRHSPVVGYLVRVDQTSHRVLGYVDQNGISLDYPSLEAQFLFESNSYNAILPWGNRYDGGAVFIAQNQLFNFAFLKLKNGIVQVNVETGELKEVYPPSYLSANCFNSFNAVNERLYIRLEDKVLSYDPSLQEFGASWVIPTEIRKSDFRIIETNSSNLLFEWASLNQKKDERIFHNVIVSNDGSVIERRDNIKSMAAVSQSSFRERMMSAVVSPAMITDSIPILAMLGGRYASIWGISKWEAMWRSFRESLDMVLVTALITVICLTVFTVRQHRYGLRIVWWQISLLTVLGFPALVALVITNPIDRSKRLLFAKPEQAGIEVFA